MAERRVGWVLGGLALLFLAQVLLRPALPIDETRYLSVAWEMHLSGDPFHLTRNFDPYTHKPPLLFWLINLAWMLGGVSDLWARLVGPACALGVVALTAWLARHLWPQDAGIGQRAALVMAGTTLFLLYGGATMFDALLTLPVLAGMAMLWRLGQGSVGRKFWALFGVVLAAGVLAKGPVVLVHLSPPLALIRLWAPQPPGLRQVLRGLGLALPVAVALVAVWLGPALLSGGAAFRHELLWDQTAERVAGGIAHDRPAWFLLAALPVLLFPFGWSWRLWPAVWRVVGRDAAARFCAVWGLAALVLFSLISGKQVHYLLPELPAFALLVARALGGARERVAGLAWIGVAAPGAAALAVVAGLVPAGRSMADVLTPPRPVALFGLVCLALAMAMLRRPGPSGQALGGAGLALALHGLVGLTGLSPDYDAGRVAAALGEVRPTAVALVGMPYNAEFNYPARLTAPVALPDNLTDWAARHPGAVVIGPVDKAGIETPPDRVIRYNGRDLGLWRTDGLSVPGSARAD